MTSRRDDIVKEKFDRIAKDYDVQRRSLIPCYDDFYGIITRLADAKHPRPRILDIGAGTGLLTGYLFERYPAASFTLIDLSDEMLKIAKARFEGFEHFRYITANYLDYELEDTYDIVVSSLSIHHLNDSDKEALYGKIHGILNSGGVFINADQVSGPTPFSESAYQRHWREKINDSRLTQSEKEGARERMKMDRPATLEDNLKWLKDSGFEDVDVYYKYYNFAIVYGKRMDHIRDSGISHLQDI